jgi:hypothetical protein
VSTWAPGQTTILGAAKVTGRIGGSSVGMLTAVTQEERGKIWSGGIETARAVEPLTSYSIARVRREFRDQSAVGLMTTLTARRLGDTAQILPGRAVTGGADFDWRLGSRFSLTGYWAGSTVSGESGAIARLQVNSRHYYQRPDATHVELDPTRTSIAGHSGSLTAGKIGGEYVRFNSNVQYVSPGFDTNDVGFHQRADQVSIVNWIQFRNQTPNKWFRTRALNLNQWGHWNWAGDRMDFGVNVNSNFTLLNNWSFGGGLSVNMDGIDDRLTRGGPAGIVDGYTVGWGFLSTDARKIVALDLFVGGGASGHGGWFRDIDPSVTFRPRSSLSIETGVRFNRNVLTQQWVDEVAGQDRSHYVFGHLNQTTVAMTARVNYTVRPTLSIQLYAEPFVSAGEY